MTIKVTYYGIDDQSIDNENQPCDAINVAAELKSKKPFKCSEIKKQDTLDYKEGAEHISGFIDGGEKADMVNDAHPKPEESKYHADVFTR